MPVTYTWTIANLESNVADGGVVIAHWQCTGVDGEASITAYGTVSFEPDPAAPGFIAYNDLTESDVLGWLYAQSDDWKTNVEAAIAEKVAEKLAPATQSGLPWNTEA